MRKILGVLLVIVAFVIIAGAGLFFFSREQATVPIEQTYGPNPTLAEPNPTWIPTVHVAEATPWPQGKMPVAAKASPSTNSLAASTIRAGCTCCPMATCWSPKAMRRQNLTKVFPYVAGS